MSENRHPLVQKFFDIVKETANNPEEELRIIANERLRHWINTNRVKFPSSKSGMEEFINSWKDRFNKLR